MATRNPPKSSKPSLLDSVRDAGVVHRQIRDLVPEGLTYYLVRCPDGSQAAFTDEAAALEYAASRGGGQVVAQPTRPALRLLAAAGGITALETPSTISTPSDGIINISTPYLSVTIIRREDSEYTVIATAAFASGDRVMPTVGACSTDEWAGDRRGAASLGVRFDRATMIAITRAINRGIADVTGLPVLGVKSVEKQESPQAAIIRKAKTLGIPLGKISAIIHRRLDQVGPDDLEDAIALLEEAASQAQRPQHAQQTERTQQAASAASADNNDAEN